MRRGNTCIPEAMVAPATRRCPKHQRPGQRRRHTGTSPDVPAPKRKDAGLYHPARRLVNLMSQTEATDSIAVQTPSRREGRPGRESRADAPHAATSARVRVGGSPSRDARVTILSGPCRRTSASATTWLTRRVRSSAGAGAHIRTLSFQVATANTIGTGFAREARAGVAGPPICLRS